MTAASDTSSPNPSVRGQTGLLFGVVVIIAALHLVAQVATHNDRILLPSLMAKWKATNVLYTDNRFYDDWDGTLRILCDQVPFADYSRGGVYFIGASRLGWALPLWDLPPHERSLISNYAIGASTHTQQWQFLRYLIDKHDLLKAGGDKTLVVLDLFVTSARTTVGRSTRARLQAFGDIVSQGTDFIPTTWCGAGVDEVPMTKAQKVLRIAEIHDESFWSWLFNLLHRTPSGGVMLQDNPQRNHPELGLAIVSRSLGVNWKPGIDMEIKELAEMIDYLQAHKVHVAGVYMPQGTWYNDYPPTLYYRQRVFELLRSKSVPYYDFAGIVPNDRFNDSLHLNYVGVHEVFPKLLSIAEDFLRSTGALPRN